MSGPSAASQPQQQPAAAAAAGNPGASKHTSGMCEVPHAEPQQLISDQGMAAAVEAGSADGSAEVYSNGTSASGHPSSSGAGARLGGKQHAAAQRQTEQAGSSSASSTEGAAGVKRKQQQRGRNHGRLRQKAANDDGCESDIEGEDGGPSGAALHRLSRAMGGSQGAEQQQQQQQVRLAAAAAEAAVAAAAATAALSCSPDSAARAGSSAFHSPGRARPRSPTQRSSGARGTHSMPLLQFGDLPPYLCEESPRGGAESDHGPSMVDGSPRGRGRGRADQQCSSSPGTQSDGGLPGQQGGRRRSTSLSRVRTSRLEHGVMSPQKGGGMPQLASSRSAEEQLVTAAAAAAAAALDKDGGGKGQRALVQNGRLSSSVNGKYIPPGLLHQLQQQQQQQQPQHHQHHQRQVNGKLAPQHAASDSGVTSGRVSRAAMSPRHRGGVESSPSPRAVHRDVMPDNAGESLTAQISPELLARFGLGVADHCNGRLMCAVRKELAAVVPDLLLEKEGLPSADQLMQQLRSERQEAARQRQRGAGAGAGTASCSSCEPSPRPGSTRRQQQQQPGSQPRSTPASPAPGAYAGVGDGATAAAASGSHPAAPDTSLVLPAPAIALAGAAVPGQVAGSHAAVLGVSGDEALSSRGGSSHPAAAGGPAATHSSSSSSVSSGPGPHSQQLPQQGQGNHHHHHQQQQQQQQQGSLREVVGTPGGWPAMGRPGAMDHLDSMSDPGVGPGPSRGGRGKQGRQAARLLEGRGGGNGGGGGRKGADASSSQADLAAMHLHHLQQQQQQQQQQQRGQVYPGQQLYGPGAGYSRSAASTPFEPALALQQMQQQGLPWDPMWAAQLGYGLPFEPVQPPPTPPFPAASPEAGAGGGRLGGGSPIWPGAPAANQPATDLQRFIAGVTPCLPVDAGASAEQLLQQLTLRDVWQLFQEPSLVGAPVVTLGGARGASTAFYVPYLSAIQVFTVDQPQPPAGSPTGQEEGRAPNSAASSSSSGGRSSSSSGSSPELRGVAGDKAPADGSPPADTGPGAGKPGQLYATGVEGWPPYMRLLCQHVEVELPFNRDPLYIQLKVMSGPPPAAPSPVSSSSGPYRGQPNAPPAPIVGPALMDTPLCQVHPASWFAVAWYPVYRIPDAPLTARFLAFYSFAQPLQVLRDAAAAAAAAAAGGSGVDRAAAEAAGAPMPHQLAPEAAAGCGLTSLQLPVVGVSWYNQMQERWKECLVEVPAASPGTSSIQQVTEHAGQQMDREVHLEELQATAATLARGRRLFVVGPKGRTPAGLYHNDFEFFVVRCT